MDISQSRRLISLYKEFKCLWDPKDVNYTNRGVREDAWRQISREMENKPIEDLKKKMRSLAGGYRREKFREKQSHITGSGAQDTYKSKWFEYDDFDLMADKNEPGITRDTLEHAIGCSDCDGGSFRQLPSITSPFSCTISNVPGDVKLELLRK
ncbi:jg20698 [Pararge aegeria aegeria]|uniref:Jg20698 protein n=1 Tax=Pararge aegeria aegeria TaxID=348720 RepID=A0A8S4RRN6_9NEOP|nr:jg20698 [Pararge aegeria aegeria]